MCEHGKGIEKLDDVLIETLWNVNNECPSILFRSFSVLIETLWNVNLLAL